ncbi:MAG: hypothetical protein P1U40_12795 [Coxiellaceae bacterium]|nr:hypothetical protein [Coxiellaceae bacterium]
MKIFYTTTIVVGSAIAATSCWASTHYFSSAPAAKQHYVSASDSQATPATKKNWQKPRVHGRGNGDLALIVMNGKVNQASEPGSPKAIPGQNWKAKPNATPKQFPGMDWKSKSKAKTKQYPTMDWKKRPPRGAKNLPGMTWKPKNRPTGAN